MTADTLSRQLLVAVSQLRDSMQELEDRSRRAADMDRAWRLAKAQSYAQTSGTIPERDAAVERETAHLRYEANMSEALKVAALEAVRSNRAIVSAMQSLIAASRAEAELARFESRETESA